MSLLRKRAQDWLLYYNAPISGEDYVEWLAKELAWAWEIGLAMGRIEAAHSKLTTPSSSKEPT
jgi:hypothetical protein